MPLYEYQCDTCGHRFERIQKFSDPPVETCPLDGGPVKKLPSSPAIQFKGSGFYITDYAKKPASGESKSGASSKDSSSEKGTSDSSGTAASKDAATPAKGDSKKESKKE